jgi:hypothetical protein
VVLEGEAGLVEFGPSEESSRAIVVGQVPGESSSELSERVVTRIAELERDGRQLERTMIRVVPDTGGDAMRARERIARALLAHAAGAAESELVFVVKSGASPEFRKRMLDLVEDLMSGVTRTRLRVVVSFGDRPAIPPRKPRSAAPGPVLQIWAAEAAQG